MKKSFALCLTVLILTMLCAAACADQTFEIEPIRTAISFPDDYFCIPIYKTPEAKTNEYEYLVAFSADYSLEFSLTCLNSSGQDFVTLRDADLQREMNASVSELTTYGVTTTDRGILRTEDQAYIVLDIVLPVDNATMYRRSYFTQKNNLAMSLTVTSEAPFTPEQSGEMRRIVDTVRTLDTADVTYSEMTIEGAGVTILRPDQWVHEKINNYPFTTNGFVYTTPEGEKRIISILYADAAPTLRQVTGIQETNRMNMGGVSKQILAAYVLGVDSTRLESVQIGGEDYYRYRMTKKEDNAAADVIYQYFHLRNGIIYMFQFDAETDDAYYPVFERVLNSIRYH